MNTENNDESSHELELWDRVSNSQGVDRARALDDLSHIAFNRNDYTECLQLVETSAEIYLAEGPELYTSDLIHLTIGKAKSLSSLNRDGEAAAAFEELARLNKETDHIEHYIGAMRDAGMHWYYVEEWQKSLDAHIAARDCLDPNSTPYSMGIDELNVATPLMKLKRYREAITCLLRALEHFKKAKNPQLIYHVDSHLAESYMALKNGPDAKIYAKRAYNFAKVADDFSTNGHARYRLGIAHRLCCEFDDAIKWIEDGLSYLNVEECKDWEAILEANRELCKALTAVGRDDEAVEILESMKTVEESLGLQAA